jgi:hypothetical protein
MHAQNGIRAYAYRNLRTGNFSVCTVKGTASKGLLVDHVPTLMLSAATFKASVKGIDRIRARGQREVVAGVIGIVDFDASVTSLEGWTEVTLDPFTDSTFVTRNGIPVFSASLVWFENNKCFVPTSDLES